MLTANDLREGRDKLAGWIRFFARAPVWLDRQWRHRDFTLNRSYGGLTQKYLKIDGFAPLALLLPGALALFIVFGPTLGWRGWSSIVILVIAWLALWLEARVLTSKRRHRWLGWVQGVTLAGLCGALWLQADADSVATSPERYRHILLAAVPVLAIFLLASRFLSAAITKRVRPADQELLTEALAMRTIVVSGLASALPRNLQASS